MPPILRIPALVTARRRRRRPLPPSSRATNGSVAIQGLGLLLLDCLPPLRGVR